MTYDKNKWIYENDSIQGNRYILGTKGVKPLLCFGINPSTAKPGELDNTLQSVARLALNNGFDSWIMKFVTLVIIWNNFRLQDLIYSHK